MNICGFMVDEIIPEQGISWGEWLKEKCTLEQEREDVFWYSNVNCHYIVQKDIVFLVYGYHGKSLFEQMVNN